MLFFLEPYRNQGYGAALVSFWEKQRKEEGHQLVMTSTLANETAQHFYRKLHYVDAGALLLPVNPWKFFYKGNKVEEY